MSVHTADRTPRNRGGEQRQTIDSAAIPYPVVASSVHALIDAQVENDHQQALVFNLSGHDSIAEYIAALLRADTDPAAIAASVLPQLRELLESERRERDLERAATGSLDRLARTLAVQPNRQGLGIKRAAAQLRGPLKVIKRAETEVVLAREYFPACCQIKDVVGMLTAEALRGGLRNALGDGPHDLLLDLLDGEATA